MENKTFDPSRLAEILSRAEIKALVFDVLAHRAGAQVVRDHVDSYVEAHFAQEYQASSDPFYNARTGEILSRSEDLYLSEQTLRCEEFFADLDSLHTAAGYDIPAEYCPALIAEMDLNDAEAALLDYAGQHIAPMFSQIVKLEHRTEALELLIGAAMAQ